MLVLVFLLFRRFQVARRRCFLGVHQNVPQKGTWNTICSRETLTASPVVANSPLTSILHVSLLRVKKLAKSSPHHHLFWMLGLPRFLLPGLGQQLHRLRRREQFDGGGGRGAPGPRSGGEAVGQKWETDWLTKRNRQGIWVLGRSRF